jgi:ethanolamine ammonia-lyase small subunit
MGDLIQSNSWDFLKKYTDARIAMGRTGHSIPTKALLNFQLAHAQAKDAVISDFRYQTLDLKLKEMGLKTHFLQSQVNTRQEYLKRPDLGRKLNSGSRESLSKLSTLNYQLSIVIADGLSSQAVETNAIPFLDLFIPSAREAGFSIAPISIVQYGRVAIGDEIGDLIHAKIVIVLIGERPGLSSPDSMGIYMTYNPQPGLSDESRNCISNIRPKGLNYKEAALKLLYLTIHSRELKLSGVNLKEDLLLE